MWVCRSTEFRVASRVASALYAGMITEMHGMLADLASAEEQSAEGTALFLDAID
jgi:hypothetical protein